MADRAAGTYVWSTDGRKLLDMAAGIGVVSTGHCHPAVAAAVAAQAGRLVNAQQNLFVGSTPMASEGEGWVGRREVGGRRAGEGAPGRPPHAARPTPSPPAPRPA